MVRTGPSLFTCPRTEEAHVSLGLPFLEGDRSVELVDSVGGGRLPIVYSVSPRVV